MLSLFSVQKIYIHVLTNPAMISGSNYLLPHTTLQHVIVYVYFKHVCIKTALITSNSCKATGKTGRTRPLQSTYTHAHTHARTHHTQAHTHARTRAPHTCTHACPHAHMHARMHTHTRAHTHTHTHTPATTTLHLYCLSHHSLTTLFNLVQAL